MASTIRLKCNLRFFLFFLAILLLVCCLCVSISCILYVRLFSSCSFLFFCSYTRCSRMDILLCFCYVSHVCVCVLFCCCSCILFLPITMTCHFRFTHSLSLIWMLSCMWRCFVLFIFISSIHSYILFVLCLLMSISFLLFICNSFYCMSSWEWYCLFVKDALQLERLVLIKYTFDYYCKTFERLINILKR